MSVKLEFGSDKVSVRGPKESDGSFSITFTTGEYEQSKVAQLLCIPQRTPLKVTVEVANQEDVDLSKYNFEKGEHGEII